jgi:pimeloyl-ACP methyl ester carboxylesterase
VREIRGKTSTEWSSYIGIRKPGKRPARFLVESRCLSEGKKKVIFGMDELLLQNGIALRKNEFAPGRDTLVFLHGLAGSSSAWDDYVGPFTQAFNLVFPDLRGHGKSRRYPDRSDYHLSLFANDLETVLSCLELSEAILVAHSFGCLVAVNHMMRYPGKIKKAILISARVDPGNQLFFGLVSLLERVLSPLYPYLPQGIPSRLDYKKFPCNTDFNPRRLYHDILNAGVSSFIRCSREALRPNGELASARIACPVLFLHGDRDHIFPVRHARENQQNLPNSRVEIIRNANHVVVLTHADLLCEKIRDFIHS